jgi:hypothetical protein
MKKILAIVSISLVTFFVFIYWNNTSKMNINKELLASVFSDTRATVTASETCGCCKLYAKYLQQQGFEVKMETGTNEQNLEFKKKIGVPDNLRSCHTTEIANYIIEGHIPVEVMKKLLVEKPDIKGIGMPDMPSGTPGMPGPKVEKFIISEITNEGAKGEIFYQM